MKMSVIKYLTCPNCSSDLELTATSGSGDIEEGYLRCNSCDSYFPITNGIPRFVKSELSREENKTANSFGYAWKQYGHVISSELNREFLERLPPWTPNDFKGKIVLDVGCGAGRLSRLASEFGAREIFAIDVSKAVDAAKSISINYSNINFIQANLFRLPFKIKFDIVFCMGVLHHTPDPGKAFKDILKPLKKGGKIGIWIYAREGNEVMGLIFNLFRHITIRLNNTTKSFLANKIVAIEEKVYKILNLFLRNYHYSEYLNYFNNVLRKDDRHYVAFDFLSTPIVHYISYDDLTTFLKESNVENKLILKVNNNSYGVTAVKA